MSSLDALLVRTSRTFALSIPFLPQPTRREVTVAYLLFRIADTFEDAAAWPCDKKVGALSDFSDLLVRTSEDRARELADRWVSERPVLHDGYLELLGETPRVLGVFRELDPEARLIIHDHLLRTTEGMSNFVSRGRESGELAVFDLDDLRSYCYIVAGIVGEMLTELFLLNRPGLDSVAADLRCRAGRFGEGLQLVNILKDSSADLAEGRRYLPLGVDRGRVFRVARTSLARGAEYVLALQRCGAPRGLVAFNALPLKLAWATLDRVQDSGPGSKLTRREVFALVRETDLALDRGSPVVSPVASSSQRAVD